MKNRQIALLAALVYKWKWSRSSGVQVDEVIEVAKKFDAFLEYRDNIQDVQDG